MLKKPRGGLWLELKKLPTVQRPIDELKAPVKVYLPLKQSKVSESELKVRIGDYVFKNQVVATAKDELSVDLHSPVSGNVKEISNYIDPEGNKSEMIVIANDDADSPYEAGRTYDENILPTQLVDVVKRSGAICSDEKGFALFSKCQELIVNKPKTIIINSVETEPYICSSQKILEENTDEVTKALKVILNCTGAKEVVYAVSDDIPSSITNDVAENAKLAGISVTVAHIPQKYPNGNEHFLMRSICAKEIAKLSKAGKEPTQKDLKVEFLMPGDILNIYRAVFEGLPQTTRIITVSGDAITNPCNIQVRIGTTVKDVLERCGLSFDPERIVLNSVMRGESIERLSTPITKDTSAIIALKAVKGGLKKSTCISCGKCVSVCPQGLMPNYIAMRAVKADFEGLKALNIDECIECGSCAYICPGRMPIVELIKNIKKAAQ